MKKVALFFIALLIAAVLAVGVSADVWYINPHPHTVLVGTNGVTFTDLDGQEIHVDLPFGTPIVIESDDGENVSILSDWKGWIPMPDGSQVFGVISGTEHSFHLLEHDDWIGPENGIGDPVPRVKARVIVDSARQSRGPDDFFSGNQYWEDIPRGATVEYQYVYGDWCYAEYYTRNDYLQSGWLLLSDLQTVVETEPPATEPPVTDPPVTDPPVTDTTPAPTPDPTPEPMPESSAEPIPESASGQTPVSVSTEEQTGPVSPAQTGDGTAQTGADTSAAGRQDEAEKKPGLPKVTKTVIICVAAAVIISAVTLVIILITVKLGRKPSDENKKDAD